MTIAQPTLQWFLIFFDKNSLCRDTWSNYFCDVYFSARNITTSRIKSNWNQLKLLKGRQPRIDRTLARILQHHVAVIRQMLTVMRQYWSLLSSWCYPWFLLWVWDSKGQCNAESPRSIGQHDGTFDWCSYRSSLTRNQMDTDYYYTKPAFLRVCFIPARAQYEKWSTFHPVSGTCSTSAMEHAISNNILCRFRA